MKKIIISFLILLAVTSSLYAIDTSLTIGYQRKASIFHSYDPLYVSINIWQDIGIFKLYGTYTNEMRKSIIAFGFSPSQDYFTVGASCNFEKVTLMIEHQCSHPVVPNFRYDGIDSSYTKICITIGDQ